MKRTQLYKQIATFTRDIGRSKRAVKIFDANCAVPLSQVTSVSLSYGKYNDGTMHYYGENKDTLHFKYEDTRGNNFHFSILE